MQNLLEDGTFWLIYCVKYATVSHTFLSAMNSMPRAICNAQEIKSLVIIIWLAVAAFEFVSFFLVVCLISRGLPFSFANSPAVKMKKMFFFNLKEIFFYFKRIILYVNSRWHFITLLTMDRKFCLTSFGDGWLTKWKWKELLRRVILIYLNFSIQCSAGCSCYVPSR